MSRGRINVSYFSISFSTVDFFSMISDQMKLDMQLKSAPGMFEFHKNQIGVDVIGTSFTFSLNNWPYLKFYSTYNLHALYNNMKDI